MSAQRLNIQSNAYTCQAFVYSHLQQPAVRLGGGRAYISLALSLLRCKITRARTLHQHPLYLYFGPGRGQYARFLSRAPAHHRGQRCLPLLFFFCLLPYPQGQQIIIQVTPARERSAPRETRETLHAVEEEPCYKGHNNKQMELKTVAISPQ